MTIHLPYDWSSWCFLAAVACCAVLMVRSLRARSVDWLALGLLLIALGMYLIGK